MQRKNRWTILGIALLIPVLGLAWWLGSPLFLDRSVDEGFPASGAAMMEEATAEPMMEEATAEPMMEEPTAEPMMEEANRRAHDGGSRPPSP